jgi:hypothetical protein
MTRLSPTELAQFTGSTEWFRHSFNKAVIYTEGVRYLADRGKAYWLIDAIASHIGCPTFNKAAAKDDRIRLLHFWKLAVNRDQTALLTGTADSGEPPFIRQKILYTDFPLESVDVWAQNNGDGYTLMLPSEY